VCESLTVVHEDAVIGERPQVAMQRPWLDVDGVCERLGHLRLVAETISYAKPGDDM